MPLQNKIQPIDSHTPDEPWNRVKPVVKSRLKRIFDLHFLRHSTSEKIGGSGGNVIDELQFRKDSANGSAAHEFESNSVCLSKMVQNFIEENNEKQSNGAVTCSRNRCNCFSGNCSDSSEDELDSFGTFSTREAIDILKSLVTCASVSERNLLADTARIVDKNKICKLKDDFSRKIVTDGLLSLGYDTSLCRSRWEKSPSCLAGEYKYIDVIISSERLLIDMDFRSEFEIARSTKAYKSLLQTLPCIFVGKADRLRKIISLVSDAAKRSLKKKGMHIPPWRKPEYVQAKWLSPHARAAPREKERPLNELGQSPQENNSVEEYNTVLVESVFALSSEGSVVEEEYLIPTQEQKPPENKPKSFQIGMGTGLASVIED